MLPVLRNVRLDDRAATVVRRLLATPLRLGPRLGAREPILPILGAQLLGQLDSAICLF